MLTAGRLLACISMALIVAVAGAAQAADGRWEPLSRQSQMGFGGSVCNTSGKMFSCFLLRCFQDKKLEFAFHYNVGDYAWNPLAKIRIDKGKTFQVPFRTMVQGMWVVAPVTDPDGTELLDALRTGTSFTFDIGYKHKFSLSGSANRIEAALSRCDPPAAPGAPVETIETSLHWNTDLPGNDIANGLSNPALAGLSWQQCETLCLADPACRAFTHNGDNDVCILKSAAGKPKPFPNATSGIVTKPAAAVAAKLLPGPEVVLDDSVGWRSDDTRASYVERIRAAAVAMGGDCEAERADASALARSFQFAAADEEAVVGKAMVFQWSSAALSKRVPVYLFVAPDVPSRLTGTGFFALGPGALGPFGIETDGGKLRGIAPLFRSAEPPKGEIGVMPLASGTMA
ncbi:MAG: hypothetical protein J0H08_17120, partial [Rhizobiales bacterium]|nr:hypothetical protein [Hyphomicrobiales bacterium]